MIAAPHEQQTYADELQDYGLVRLQRSAERCAFLTIWPDPDMIWKPVTLLGFEPESKARHRQERGPALTRGRSSLNHADDDWARGELA